MTLTELKYIVAVANERHFGRAADKCFVSQPTLSVGIRKLEDELGVALFERDKQEVRLTAVGERIVAQAARVLEEAGLIKKIAESGRDPLAEPLKVGAIYTVAPYLYPRLIPALQRTTPQLHLLLEENFTSRLTERLRQGEVDVIIIALPFIEPGVDIQPLYHEPFTVAVPHDHPWHSHTTVQPDELADETTLLLGTGHCFRDQVLQACPELNRPSSQPGEMQKTLEGSSLETIRHMVASGTGVTVLPCTAAGANPLLRYLPFAEPVPQRTIALAWRKSFPRPEAVAALRQAILASDIPCVSLINS